MDGPFERMAVCLTLFLPGVGILSAALSVRRGMCRRSDSAFSADFDISRNLYGCQSRSELS